MCHARLVGNFNLWRFSLRRRWRQAVPPRRQWLLRAGADRLARQFDRVETVDVHLNELHDHVVLVGYGRIGATVSEALARGGVRQVVIEEQERVVADLRKRSALAIRGDASRPDVLERARIVRFGPVEIPILSPEHLIVCKVVFDRPKDWLDIEEILRWGTEVDAARTLSWVRDILGPDSAQYNRLADLLSAEAPAGPGVRPAPAARLD